mgnify:CR=1 FL=1
MVDQSHKTAWITGASSGIGEALAKAFVESGGHAVLSGRNVAELERVAHATGAPERCFILPFDTVDYAALPSKVAEAIAYQGKIDVLVNNAGLASGLAPIHEGNIDDWEIMIDTNIKGLLYVSRAIMPGMVARKSGHIINISSIAGKEAYPKGNVYCATKHAVDALTKSMRIDLLPFGIRVTSINPGAAETEFSLVRFAGDEERAKQVYKGYTPLRPEDIADIIYYAASRPPPRYFERYPCNSTCPS